MDYEKAISKLEKESKKYLKKFAEVLEKEDMEEGVYKVDERCDDVEFYLVDFLPREDCFSVKDGFSEIGMFFSYFLRHKVMGIGVTDAMRMGDSVRRFYSWLKETGEISADQYDHYAKYMDRNLLKWLTILEKTYYPDEFDSGDNDEDDEEEMMGFLEGLYEDDF